MLENLKFKHWFILVLDLVYLWYCPMFFTLASTFMNILGIILFVTLFILTIKIFKK